MIMLMERRILVLSAIAMLAAGCASKAQMVSLSTGQSDLASATADIKVAPGYEERLALMGNYRLHDEMRLHMMKRPHVTVEQLSDDDETPAETPAPATEEAQKAPDPAGCATR